MLRYIALIAVIIGCQIGYADGIDSKFSPEIRSAVQSMRKIDPSKITEKEEKEQAEKLDKSWKTLIDSGPEGAAALKEELKNIEKLKEKDDFFKLGAAAVLWQIGKVDEAQTIASLWSGDIDLSLNYNYLFFTAFEAARTQDPRVLPMLIALLRDKKGEVFIPQHYLKITWPLSHEFIWGAYGSKGVPALGEVLQNSKDDTAVASAICLLGDDMDLQSLDKIRSLARDSSGEARNCAIAALGRFGHPRDFDFLVSGLNGKNTDDLFLFAFALYEYGDTRAAAHLIPLLSTPDDRLGNEVIACLKHLPTIEGIEALERFGSDEKDEKRRNTSRKAVKSIFEPLNLTYEKYAEKTSAKKTKTIKSIIELGEDKYRMKSGDKKLTHAELLDAAADWKHRNRITGGKYEWVEDRHVLNAATPADIPLLLDVTGSCYLRLSDECLYEVNTLQSIIQRLSRSQYRTVPGICDKAQEPAKK